MTTLSKRCKERRRAVEENPCETGSLVQHVTRYVGSERTKEASPERILADRVSEQQLVR